MFDPLPDFTFVDLFAGIGGFHRGLAGLSGRCALAVEIDETCRSVYQTAFPDTPIVADIRALTRAPDGTDLPLDAVAKVVPDHDVLCAGFPCQPFSKSGAQLGIRDQTRGTLFFDVMTIALAKQPEVILLENVRNLAGPRHEDTWKTIIRSLKDAGYLVHGKPVVISPHRLHPDRGGSAQVRDRVFILARRSPTGIGGEADPVELSALTAGWDPDRWDAYSLLGPTRRTKALAPYYLRDDELAWLDAWQCFIQGIPEDLPGHPIWVDAFDEGLEIPDDDPGWRQYILERNRDFYGRNKAFIDEWLKVGWGRDGLRVADFPVSRRKFEWQARKRQPTQRKRDIWDLLIQFRPSGIRVKPPTYLPALVAITQTTIVGRHRRRITPAEAARLQGMPPDIFANAGVSDKAAYRQLGNAVNADLVREVVRTWFGQARPEFLERSVDFSPVI